MSQTVNVNFRMDSALKNHEDIICEELGRKICRKKKIHFEVSVDPLFKRKHGAV